MTTAHFVRIKAASVLARELSILPDALGTVLCRYQLFRSNLGDAERLDVRFSSEIVVWGMTAGELEMVPDNPNVLTLS